MKSAIFSSDGSYSFPFNLPATYENRKALGFPARLSLKQKSKSFDCILQISSRTFEASLFVIDANDDEIRVSVLLNDILYNRDGKTLITDLNYDEIPLSLNDVDAETYLNDSLTSGYPDYKFVLPEFVSTENGFGAANQYVFFDNNAQGVDAVPGIKYPESSLMPQIYLKYVIDQFLADFDYKLTADDFFQITEINKLLVLGVGGVRYSADPNYRKIIIKDHLPYVSFLELVERLKHTFSATFFKNHFTKEVKLKLLKNILTASPQVDLTKRAKITDIMSDKMLDGFVLSHEFSETDDIWKEKVHDMRDEVVTATYTSLSNVNDDAHVSGEFFLVEPFVGHPRSAYYRFNSSGNYELFSYKFQSYLNGDINGNLEKFEKQITGPLTLPWDFDYNYHRYFISPLFVVPQEKRKDQTLRLLFYRGMQPGGMTPIDPHYPDGIDIPLASMDVWSYLDVKVPGANLALRNDGQYGLVENFWKNWINWSLTTRLPVKAISTMAFPEIMELDFSLPVRIDTENYLINSMDFEVDIDDEIKFVKMNLERL
ncbi:MAG: hypothetical protein PF448_13165 [Bacteroidales bacterium]|nr:hypothetical protein [Bacteroidales bacterium]